MGTRITKLVAILLIIPFTLFAQSKEKDKEKEKGKSEAEIRRQVQQEMEDSIARAQALNKPKLTNNEGLEREKLQIDLEVDETLVETGRLSFGEDTYPAIIADIPAVDTEQIQAAWTKILEENTKSKVMEGVDGTIIEGAIIEPVSSQTIKVYTSILKTEYGVRLIAAFEEGDSDFINENENKVNSAKALMKEFGVEQYTEFLRTTLKEEEKLLNDMEKDLKKLQKDNEKIHKLINENELKIISTKNDEKVNLMDQERLVDEIASKKSTISKLEKDARKDVEKELKDLEKEKKQLQKELEKMNSDVIGYRASIEESNRLIQRNLSEQDLQKARISQQLNYVKSLEGKVASLEH